MIEVKMGAIVRIVPKGALKWYLMAGWKVLENVKTNSKKTITK